MALVCQAFATFLNTLIGADDGLPSLSLCFEMVLQPKSTPSNSQGCCCTQNCECGDDLQIGLRPLGSFLDYK